MAPHNAESGCGWHCPREHPLTTSTNRNVAIEPGAETQHVIFLKYHSYILRASQAVYPTSDCLVCLKNTLQLKENHESTDRIEDIGSDCHIAGSTCLLAGLSFFPRFHFSSSRFKKPAGIETDAVRENGIRQAGSRRFHRAKAVARTDQGTGGPSERALIARNPGRLNDIPAPY